METPWTVEMLAQQLLAQGATLSRHMAGCEEGQLKQVEEMRVMSAAIREVVSTSKETARIVGGYQKVIAGGWASVGKLLLGIAVIVGASVVVTTTQNASLHKDTAAKVETTASTLATVTASHAEAAQTDTDHKYDQILLELRKRR